MDISKDDYIKNHTFKSFVWGRIYRKNIISDMRFRKSLSFAEDKAFNIEVVCENNKLKIGFTMDSLYFYRFAQNSAMSRWNVSWQKEIAYWFYQESELAKGTKKRIMLSEAIKNLLCYRYYLKSNHDEKIRTNKMLKDCMKNARKNHLFSKKRLYDLFLFYILSRTLSSV